MVRHTNTEPDVDVDEWSTDRLADYINRVAPVAANLPDGEYAEPVLTANAAAAIAEFRDRHGIDADDTDHLTGDDRDPTDDEVDWGNSVDGFEAAVGQAVTDGGVDAVDAVVDDEVGADTDHYLRHVTDDDYDHKIRHDGSIRTRVEDGYVVHTVAEQYDDGADGDSLSWSGVPSCPLHGHSERTKERDRDADAGVTTVRWACDGDDGACPFEATMAEVAGKGDDNDDLPGYGDPDYERPLWFRATVPHDFDADAEGIDAGKWSDFVDDAETDEDVEMLANGLRSLKTKNTGMVTDAAYVSAEYDGQIGDDDTEKVADAYIDTFECARCGAEHDVGADKSHPAFDDPVCRDCEDVRMWSIDDADLPDDVDAAVDDYASVTRSKIRALLRDVRWYPAFVAAADDDTDVDDAPACPTGRQGERRIQGVSKPGTGLRRPDGAAHGDANWRIVVREARDAGLIERVDDEDVDFDHPDARWVVTDKGADVLDALARCEWCGGDCHAFREDYKVKLSRWSTADQTNLILACPDRCRTDLRGPTDLTDA